MNTVTLLTPQKLVAANNGGTNTPAFYASVLCLTTPVYV